jgi:hypothetical protein
MVYCFRSLQHPPIIGGYQGKGTEKIRKACKKLVNFMKHMVTKKKRDSVDTLKEAWETLTQATDELKCGHCSSTKHKSSKQNVKLMEKCNCHLYEEILKVEMPLLEEGNPKHFHDSLIKYNPMLLMFKKKLGHLIIPGVDTKNEWPELQGWLKKTRSAMSKYEKQGSGRFDDEPQYYELLVAARVSVRGSNMKNKNYVDLDSKIFFDICIIVVFCDALHKCL